MEIFSALLTICAGNSPVPGEFPHKGQWRGALMFSLICVWIIGWVNNRQAGDLRRYHAHCDVTVMKCFVASDIKMKSLRANIHVYTLWWIIPSNSHQDLSKFIDPLKMGQQFISKFSNSYQGEIYWVFPVNCPQVTAKSPHWWLVNIGSGYGLVPSFHKPLPGPVLTNHITLLGNNGLNYGHFEGNMISFYTKCSIIFRSTYICKFRQLNNATQRAHQWFATTYFVY